MTEASRGWRWIGAAAAFANAAGLVALIGLVILRSAPAERATIGAVGACLWQVAVMTVVAMASRRRMETGRTAAAFSVVAAAAATAMVAIADRHPFAFLTVGGSRAAGTLGVGVYVLLVATCAAGAAFAVAAVRHGRSAGSGAWRAAGLVLGAGALFWLAALAGFGVKRFVLGTDGSVLQALLWGDGWPLLAALAALAMTAIGAGLHGVALAGRR
jgi:hypothetical protein